jgi:hypothetical protein
MAFHNLKGGPEMNRRQLFQVAATAATGVTVARRTLAASATNCSATEIAADEDFWSAVRDEFTTDRDVINLNNGHVSLSPRSVQEAMRRYLDSYRLAGIKGLGAAGDAYPESARFPPVWERVTIPHRSITMSLWSDSLVRLPEAPVNWAEIN